MKALEFHSQANAPKASESGKEVVRQARPSAQAVGACAKGRAEFVAKGFFQDGLVVQAEDQDEFVVVVELEFGQEEDLVVLWVFDIAKGFELQFSLVFEESAGLDKVVSVVDLGYDVVVVKRQAGVVTFWEIDGSSVF